MTYRAVVLPTAGLVGYWRLGENAGTTAKDSKSTHDGTYTSGFTLSQTGGPNGDSNPALGTDGATGSKPVSVPHSAALMFAGSFSIEALVYPTSFNQAGSGNAPAIAAKESAAGADGYSLHLNSAGHVVFSTAGRTDAASPDTVSTGVLPLNTWAHIVATYDGTLKRIYINGQLDKTSGTLSGTMTTNTSALIFGNTLAGGRSFQGRLDEIAVYSVALSGATVSAHYAAFLAAQIAKRNYRLSTPGVEIDLSVTNDRDASEVHHPGESGVGLTDAEVQFLQSIGIMPRAPSASSSSGGRWDWSWSIPRQG